MVMALRFEGKKETHRYLGIDHSENGKGDVNRSLAATFERKRGSCSWILAEVGQKVVERMPREAGRRLSHLLT